MASWTHWFWVTTFLIADLLLGDVVAVDSLLVGPVRTDQMSLQVGNFPEVWRQARGGFPVTIPIRGQEGSPVIVPVREQGKEQQTRQTSRVEQKINQLGRLSSFVGGNDQKSNLLELGHNPSLNKESAAEYGKNPSLKEEKVSGSGQLLSLKEEKVSKKEEIVSELGNHNGMKEPIVSELGEHSSLKKENLSQIGQSPSWKKENISELGQHPSLKELKVPKFNHHSSLGNEEYLELVHLSSSNAEIISQLVDHSSLIEEKVSELGHDSGPAESQVIKVVPDTVLEGEKGIKPRYDPILAKVNISEHHPQPNLVQDIIIEPIDESTFVTTKVNNDSPLKENKLTNAHTYPDLVNRKINNPAKHGPVLAQTVTEHFHKQQLKDEKASDEHKELVLKTTKIQRLGQVTQNTTFSTMNEEILPVTRNTTLDGERMAPGTPKQALAIKLLVDKSLENNSFLVKQPEHLYDKESGDAEHKSSEEQTKVTLKGTRWSVYDSKLENDSNVSVREASNRTIIPRHYKHKFSQVESQSDSQVTSAETGGTQQIYNQQNTPNLVRVKKLDIDIADTTNRSGNLNMNVEGNKKQFGNSDTDTHIHEQSVISDGNYRSSDSHKNEYVSKTNETLDDEYIFDPVEMQPTEPSIEEEMNKFIRIFRKDQNDPIKIQSMRTETASEKTDINTQEGNAKLNGANYTENLNFNDANPNVNTPFLESRLPIDNGTSFSSANLAKLKSLAHVKTGDRDENFQTKLQPSAEDSGLNSSRAGKAINRRPVLIQVKPEDISIIFSKSFHQEGPSPYQTKDLKDQKVSSRELNKVKEHIIAKTVSIEEKQPQKDTLITHNQREKWLLNQGHTDENVSLETSENNGLKKMVNRHLENLGLLKGGDKRQIKYQTESIDSSPKSASAPSHDDIGLQGQIDHFMRGSLLPYLAKSRTTYPPLRTSLTELEADMRRSGPNTGDNIYHQGSPRGRHIEHGQALQDDSPLEGPDTLAMTRKEHNGDSYEGTNNSDKDVTNDIFDNQDSSHETIDTKEMFGDQQDNPHGLIASASFIDFISPTDNQSMENPHIRIEVEGRAVTKKFMDVTNIVAVALGTIVFIMIVTVVSALVLYRRRFLLKPHSLDECYTNSESGSSCWTEQDIFQTVSYEDCQGMDLPRDNSEEMFNLDNDSFLNSLEAMTIPEYWNESVRHTKL